MEDKTHVHEGRRLGDKCEPAIGKWAGEQRHTSSVNLGDSGARHLSPHSGQLPAPSHTQSLMPNMLMGSMMVCTSIPRTIQAPFCPILGPGMQLMLRTYTQAKQSFMENL